MGNETSRRALSRRPVPSGDALAYRGRRKAAGRTFLIFGGAIACLGVPVPSLALGGLDDQTSTRLILALFLFFTVGSFIASGPRGGAIMLLAFGIFFVVEGVGGNLPMLLAGVPLQLAIGVVSSIVAAIILAAIRGR